VSKILTLSRPVEIANRQKVPHLGYFQDKHAEERLRVRRESQNFLRGISIGGEKNGTGFGNSGFGGVYIGFHWLSTFAF